MERFIPFEKLSKKEQRRLSSAKRNNWYGLNPATRVADTDKRRYKRKPKHPERYF